MAKTETLTVNEAGYVVGQTSTAINRIVDRGVINVELERTGKHILRKVGPAELRYLAIAGKIERDLTPTARKKVYEAVRTLPAGANRIEVGVLEVKLADIDQVIAQRLTRLQEIKSLVDVGDDGQPVVRGTTIPVYPVAALAEGQTIAEICQDYPSLAPSQIEAAIEYANIYPRTGRPLPARSFKRMLADAAEAGLWDTDDATELSAPMPIP